MSTVGEVIGSEKLVDRIENALIDATVVRITGDPGSGKSTVASHVGIRWQDAGGSAVIATGDHKQADRAYFPFLAGLAELNRDWLKLLGQGSRSALKVLDVVQGTGGIASGLFDLLGSARRQKIERATRTLNATEREIFGDLRRMAKGKPLLLIIDNAHWWDQHSISLLEQLLSPLMVGAVPELAAMKVLLVDTERAQAPSDESAFSKLTALSEDSLSMENCAPERYGELLEAFGVTHDMPNGLVGEIHTITGGHLKLTEQVAAYLTERGAVQSVDDLPNLEELIADRIRTLGQRAQTIEHCLSMASVMGLSFDLRELACAVDSSPSATRKLLVDAEELSLVRTNASVSAFAHDVLRSFFLEQQSDDAIRESKQQIEQCVSKLRPSDYELRAKLLIEAGRKNAARDLFALRNAQRLRLGVSLTSVIADTLEVFVDDEDFLEWTQRMAEGYDAIANGRHHEGFKTLSVPTHHETLLMGAERNYAAAICAMELQTADGFETTLRLLATWCEQVTHEPDLRLRMQLILQQANVLYGRYEEARLIETTLEAELLTRTGYDEGAQWLLQVQNRRAGSVHSPEIAEVRIERSAAYFAKQTENSAALVESYRSLTNLSGSRIQLGKYSLAHEAAQAAERLVVETEGVAFPRKDVLGNNLILAAYRTGEYSLTEATECQLAVVQSEDGRGDNFLQRCNLAAYLALSGEFDKASDGLDELNREVLNTKIEEGFLLYYLRSLEVGVALLGGHRIQAERMIKPLGELVDGLQWTTAAYVRRRQDVLEKMIAEASNDDVWTDQSLLSKYPKEIGPCWDHVARLMPCVELDFWSDS